MRRIGAAPSQIAMPHLTMVLEITAMTMVRAAAAELAGSCWARLAMDSAIASTSVKPARALAEGGYEADIVLGSVSTHYVFVGSRSLDWISCPVVNITESKPASRAARMPSSPHSAPEGCRMRTPATSALSNSVAILAVSQPLHDP